MQPSKTKDSTIIGQEKLVNELDKIFEIFKNSKGMIKPHFILTGESGNSKTYTIKTLAAKHELGFIDVNAAQLTKEGTSGNSLSKALTPLLAFGNKLVIVFVDEFDKLFISGNSNDSHAHETTTGVQNEFLKVLESDTTQVFGDYGKYVTASSKNALFVFSGAFNGERIVSVDRLREMGIKTEFLGRVGLVYSTKRLTLEDLYAIVDRSELLNMYLKLVEGVDREFVVLAIKGYIQRTYEMNTLGARLINTIIHQYFIKGGQLDEQEVTDMAFQNKIAFNAKDN